MSEPFRDNEASVREHAARLAHEIAALDQELIVANREARERPPKSGQWKDAIDGFAVVLVVIGVVLGIVVGAATLKPSETMQTTNCGFH